MALASLACRPSHTTTPDDRRVPPIAEDPAPGDPTDIEGDEIGEDVPDDAELVEPGPADAAVNEPESLETPP